MDELMLNIKQNPGVIELNFDEIEAALDAKLEEYKGAVFTEESKTIAKKEVAGLRKFKEKFEDARKSVKREWMKPYDEFESRMKRLTAKIDEPINLIDAGHIEDSTGFCADLQHVFDMLKYRESKERNHLCRRLI